MFLCRRERKKRVDNAVLGEVKKRVTFKKRSKVRYPPLMIYAGDLFARSPLRRLSSFMLRPPRPVERKAKGSSEWLE